MGLQPSVISEDEIRQILQERYSIGTIDYISRLAGGDNTCYFVQTPEDELVLKEIALNGMNHPEEEPVVAGQLARDGIPVPRYFPAVDGKYVWYLRDRAFHLQEFIPGERYERNGAPDWLLGDASELLGRLHASLSHLPRLEDGMGTAWVQAFDMDWLKRSYQQTQVIAEEQGEPDLAADAAYRLAHLPFLERFQFDFDRATCRNTHGDYHIRQLICRENAIRAVIDLTSACVHPIIWEVIRSYTFADPACKDGEIHVDHLKETISRYLKHGYLNPYDLSKMPGYYFYQLLRSNYIRQYFNADPSGKVPARDVAVWSTKLCRWFAENGDSLAEELACSF